MFCTVQHTDHYQMIHTQPQIINKITYKIIQNNYTVLKYLVAVYLKIQYSVYDSLFLV